MPAIGKSKNNTSGITFYNNIAVVCFEKEEYGACIKTCETAIEIGKEHRADSKLMTKAYNRAGKAFRKMGNIYTNN